MADGSKSNLRIFLLLVVLAIVGGMYGFFRAWRNELSRDAHQHMLVESGSEANADSAKGGDAAAPASGRRDERRSLNDPLAKDAEAIDYLREQFGATISNKRTQIKALEKLIGYLMKQYPDDWQKRLQGLLAQAFPDMADQLYAQYLNMTAYNEWLAAHRTELNEMTAADKRDALREARARYFGEDANEIWEETNRHEQIYDAMDAINQSHDATVDQKLKTYVDSINEAYGENAPEFLEKRQTELLTGFLALPSVQDDLHSMTPEARASELDTVRAKMGLDEEARARWRDLDKQRDDAWDVGERYMDEREQIVKQYQGDEQARRLADLRQRTFGEDAETIHHEEDANFFRFGHRRVYGKE